MWRTSVCVAVGQYYGRCVRPKARLYVSKHSRLRDMTLLALIRNKFKIYINFECLTLDYDLGIFVFGDSGCCFFALFRLYARLAVFSLRSKRSFSEFVLKSKGLRFFALKFDTIT